MRSRVEIFLFSLIALLCPLAYHPAFIGERGISNERVVYPMLLFIGILAFISIRDLGKHNKLIHFFFLSTVFIGIEILIFNVTGLISEFSEIVTMIQCLIGLLIGYNLSIKKTILLNILRIFVIASVVIGVINVFRGIGAFEIVDQYLIVGKNASGVLVALAGVISFYLSTIDENKLIRVVDYFLVFVCLLILMTIRARLAMLSLIIVIFLYLLKKRSFKLIIWVAFSILFVLIVFPDSYTFFYDSIFMNREDDLSSGRADMNRSAIAIIMDSPFLGNLTNQYNLTGETFVHNFCLLKMSSYGIILSIPWIALYFYLLFNVVRAFIKKNNQDTICVLSQLLIMLLFIESVGEYTYPFGPGTITIIPFVIFGYALRLQVRLKQQVYLK